MHKPEPKRTGPKNRTPNLSHGRDLVKPSIREHQSGEEELGRRRPGSRWSRRGRRTSRRNRGGVHGASIDFGQRQAAQARARGEQQEARCWATKSIPDQKWEFSKPTHRTPLPVHYQIVSRRQMKTWSTLKSEKKSLKSKLRERAKTAWTTTSSTLRRATTSRVW